MGLTRKQRQFYDDNGYLVVENIIDQNVLERLRAAISEMTTSVSEARGLPMPHADAEPLAGAAGHTAKAPLRKLSELVPHDPFFRGIAEGARIVDIAAELAGDAKRLMLYSDQAFLKPALCGSEKPLHQDNSYFRVQPQTHGVTCWMAVDDATIENGCMNYIPGSHKLGLLHHKALSPAHLTPDVDFKLNDEVPVPVKAGSAIFHHLLCLHSSRANTSNKARRAWALHYANRDAVSSVKPWEQMIQVR